MLSPRRARKGEGISHDRTITTDTPDVVWGTDGTRVMTVEEGLCWVFTAVGHFNCEVVGHHVCKRGDRFATLQPVAQGLLKHVRGATPMPGADRPYAWTPGRTTSLITSASRSASGSWKRNTLSSSSRRATRWPSSSSVLCEEQIGCGRIYRDVSDLREAVDTSVALFNGQWRHEKDGFLSPSERRRE